MHPGRGTIPPVPSLAVRVARHFVAGDYSVEGEVESTLACGLRTLAGQHLVEGIPGRGIDALAQFPSTLQWIKVRVTTGRCDYGRQCNCPPANSQLGRLVENAPYNQEVPHALTVVGTSVRIRMYSE